MAKSLNLEKCEKGLVKVLVSTFCEKNCYYCPFSRVRDFRRTFIDPEKLSDYLYFMHIKTNLKGFFISSSVHKTTENSQEKINLTAYYLRKKRGFKGYLHLKIIPGSPEGLVKEALFLGNRISINLEAPSEKRLKQIAPEKKFNKEILSILYKIKHLKELYKDFGVHRKTVCTQFVVGAKGERDYEYLKTGYYLLKNKLIDTIYFSAFRPVSGSYFENLRAVPRLREKRLYQAFKLIKYYHFEFKDLYFDEKGNLFLEKDPKIIWAEKNQEFFPVDIIKGEYQELLRVPGIGPKRAMMLIKERKNLSYYDFENRGIKLLPHISLNYISIRGKTIRKQLSLF